MRQLQRIITTALTLGLILGGIGCDEKQPAAPPPEAAAPAPEAAAAAAPVQEEITFTKDQLSSFGLLPARFDRKDNPVNEAKITLGRMLYFEERLSKNHDVSCNTCHTLSEFGVDPRGDPTSAGHKEQMGTRHSPTVYNAALHFKQFWDGRSDTIEDQAKGPVLNPVEMAMPDEKAVLKVLTSIPEYVDLFKQAFPGQKNPVTYDNMAMAIGVFERGLMTPSRFDTFLGGDEAALTLAEKKGLKTFLALGCPTCHNGAAIGGTSFQKLGLVEDWPDQKDLGRFDVTKDEADKMKFKPPTLRNIAKTAPYLHTGKIDELGEMVRLMARHQLGKKDVSDEEVEAVVTFLGALTGEIDEVYTAEPTLPESTKKTPRPDPT